MLPTARLVEVGVGAGVNFPYFKQAGVKEVDAVSNGPWPVGDVAERCDTTQDASKSMENTENSLGEPKSKRTVPQHRKTAGTRLQLL
jgi:hypothetical protein